MRSKLTHGATLLMDDLSMSAILRSKYMQEWILKADAELVVRLALIAWLEKRWLVEAYRAATGRAACSDGDAMFQAQKLAPNPPKIGNCPSCAQLFYTRTVNKEFLL